MDKLDLSFCPNKHRWDKDLYGSRCPTCHQNEILIVYLTGSSKSAIWTAIKAAIDLNSEEVKPVVQG